MNFKPISQAKQIELGLGLTSLCLAFFKKSLNLDILD